MRWWRAGASRVSRAFKVGRAGALFQRRIAGPLGAQLRQGATPTRLAWSLSLGISISVLPLPGTTTAICVLVALALRLNPVAIQVANFAAAPLQLALLLPFIQLGQRLFGEAPLPLARADLRAALAQGVPAFVARFGWGLAHGLVVWALCAPLFALGLQLALRPLLVRGLRSLELSNHRDRDRADAGAEREKSGVKS